MSKCYVKNGVNADLLPDKCSDNFLGVLCPAVNIFLGRALTFIEEAFLEVLNFTSHHKTQLSNSTRSPETFNRSLDNI